MKMLPDDPDWLKSAWLSEGEKEFDGPNSSSWIQSIWLKKPGGRWFWEQRSPWCGAFTADCFEQVGIPFPKDYARAKAWAGWGTKLDRPVRGCVVVFGRQGGGHVGFVVGEDPNGDLLVLGGNQNDAVRVSKFLRGAALAYRWPPGQPVARYLELARGDAAASTSEA